MWDLWHQWLSASYCMYCCEPVWHDTAVCCRVLCHVRHIFFPYILCFLDFHTPLFICVKGSPLFATRAATNPPGVPPYRCLYVKYFLLFTLFWVLMSDSCFKMIVQQTQCHLLITHFRECCFECSVFVSFSVTLAFFVLLRVQYFLNLTLPASKVVNCLWSCTCALLRKCPTVFFPPVGGRNTLFALETVKTCGYTWQIKMFDLTDSPWLNFVNKVDSLLMYGKDVHKKVVASYVDWKISVDLCCLFLT